MWENILEPDRQQMTIWHLCIVCWIPKATNSQSEYALLIAFPLQQWVQKCASVLCYMYIACLVTHRLHPMQKQERDQLSHLANLYSLQMTSDPIRQTCPVLTKTRYSWTHFLFLFNRPLVIFFSPLQCHHMSLMDFSWFSPSRLWPSVTDFWGWDAYEARLRYPDEVYGDIWIWSTRRGLKPKFYYTTQTMAEPGIEPGTSWSVVRDSDH